MTLQFKRSKKLEHALKCMRESHIDNDSSYFSAVSTEGSATTGDDDTHDDTNTTESEQPKTMQNNYLTCFSQDKQHTPRDPEAMMKGETGAGNGLGTRGASNDPSEFQLFKTAKPIYARKGDPNIKATTKSGLISTTNDRNTISASLDLKKKLPAYLDKKQIHSKATHPKAGMYSKVTTGNHGNTKELDEYQRELFGAIEAFEARRNKRLQQLGFNEEPRVTPSKQVRVEPAPMAFEDRNDTSAHRSPPILPPPHPAPPVVEKLRRQPTPKVTRSSRLLLPMHSSEQQKMMMSGQKLPSAVDILDALDQMEATVIPDREQPIVTTGQLANVLDRIDAIKPDREQPAVTTVQRTNKLDRIDDIVRDRLQQNVTTGQQTNQFDRMEDIVDDREQPIEMTGKLTNTAYDKEVILSHLAEVANRLVKSKELMESSPNTVKVDLNKRVLRENTSELLRNLAILRGHASKRSNSGRMMTPEMDKVSMAAETKVMGRPTEAKAQSNISLLRAKRDKAARAVRKDMQRLSNMLESSTYGTNPDDFPKEEYYDGGRLEEECFRSRAGGDQLDSHRFDDRVDRLDRVKSMLEELRYLRSAKYNS